VHALHELARPLAHRQSVCRSQGHAPPAAESSTWSESELVHRRREEEDAMGELIVTEFVTLDGVAQAPGGPDEDRDGGFTYGGWQAPLLDQEAGGVIFERARSMDALLLGRKTYEIFASIGRPLQRRSRSPACSTVSPSTSALRLIESVTSDNGTLQLTYDTAGTPTYGTM
jgi:hypothetical protein